MRSVDGFTITELLTTILMMGILSAIAIPGYLQQTIRARESEALSNLTNINQLQTFHFLENQSFAASLTELQSGIPPTTANYSYSVTGSIDSATSSATAITDQLKSVTSGLTVDEENRFKAIVCKTLRPSRRVDRVRVVRGRGQARRVECPGGSRRVR